MTDNIPRYIRKSRERIQAAWTMVRQGFEICSMVHIPSARRMGFAVGSFHNMEGSIGYCIVVFSSSLVVNRMGLRSERRRCAKKAVYEVDVGVHSYGGGT